MYVSSFSDNAAMHINLTLFTKWQLQVSNFQRLLRPNGLRAFNTLKPRPYQQQCPSNIVECYKFNDSFDNVECCFDIVAGFGNKVECCFDKVERSFDNVAGVDGA